MVFPIVGGTQSTGYDVANSLMFNASEGTDYLSRQNSSGGSRQTFTISFWYKRASTTSGMKMFTVGTSTSTDTGLFTIHHDANGRLIVAGGATTYRTTSQSFRDSTAWYHLVVAVDSTDSTADDRVKIYMNGSQLTSFDAGSSGTMTQNQNTPVNEANKYHEIGRNQPNTNQYFDGIICEFNQVDGAQLTPNYFGEFNSEGVWVPVKPGTGAGGAINYGTNGAFLEFKQTGSGQNSSGTGADTSGNDNHFARNGLSAPKSGWQDTCTNNFMTLNYNLPDGQFNTSEFTKGGTNYNADQGNDGAGQPTGTFALKSGKWYWEVRVPSEQNNRALGFCRMDRVSIDNPPQLHGTGFSATNSVVGINLQDDTIDQVDNAGSHTQHASGLTGMSNDDIFGVALNMDDGNFQFYRNGSAYGSSYNLDNASEWQEHGAVPCATGGSYQAFQFNFGNPPYSNSSSQTDGLYGDFEYAPPSGYYACCTKRLAEFG